MCLRENGFFTSWLESGEQRLPPKRLQPLKELNAKAAKETVKVKHPAFRRSEELLRRNPMGKAQVK